MSKKKELPEQDTIKDTQFEKLIEDARNSKHTDAVLHLYASKEIIKENFMKILTEMKKDLPITPALTKTVSVVCEFIFKQCVQVLVDDKDEDVKE